MTDQIARTATGLVISSVRDKTITVIIEEDNQTPFVQKDFKKIYKDSSA